MSQVLSMLAIQERYQILGQLLVLLLQALPTAMNHSVLVLEERVVHIILVIALVFTGVGLTG
ncbi:MAG: hypothetical protein WA323_08840, partial [Candidatus Nitrosopolaris sp.]